MFSTIFPFKIHKNIRKIMPRKGIYPFFLKPQSRVLISIQKKGTLGMIFPIFLWILKGNIVENMECYTFLESTWTDWSFLVSKWSQNYWVLSAQPQRFQSHRIFQWNFENFIMVNFNRRKKVIHQMKAETMGFLQILSVLV